MVEAPLGIRRSMGNVTPTSVGRSPGSGVDSAHPETSCPIMVRPATRAINLSDRAGLVATVSPGLTLILGNPAVPDLEFEEKAPRKSIGRTSNLFITTPSTWLGGLPPDVERRITDVIVDSSTMIPAFGEPDWVARIQARYSGRRIMKFQAFHGVAVGDSSTRLADRTVLCVSDVPRRAIYLEVVRIDEPFVAGLVSFLYELRRKNAILFVANRDRAKELAEEMNRLGFRPASSLGIRGSRETGADHHSKIVVAVSGLPLAGAPAAVDYIIHADPPETPEAYQRDIDPFCRPAFWISSTVLRRTIPDDSTRTEDNSKFMHSIKEYLDWRGCRHRYLNRLFSGQEMTADVGSEAVCGSCDNCRHRAPFEAGDDVRTEFC